MQPAAAPLQTETPRRYTAAAIWLHWLVAALIFANMALALSVDHWPDEWVRPVIDTHKSIESRSSASSSCVSCGASRIRRRALPAPIVPGADGSRTPRTGSCTS